jgi:hypothetical protein
MSRKHRTVKGQHVLEKGLAGYMKFSGAEPAEPWPVVHGQASLAPLIQVLRELFIIDGATIT